MAPNCSEICERNRDRIFFVKVLFTQTRFIKWHYVRIASTATASASACDSSKALLDKVDGFSTMVLLSAGLGWTG